MSLFDPQAFWRGLKPERQEKIGMCAVVIVISALRGGDLHDKWDKAGVEALALLEAGLIEDIPAMLTSRGFPLPDLQKLGTPVCRVCGCTNHCACDDGCSWVEPDLCSSCLTEATHG